MTSDNDISGDVAPPQVRTLADIGRIAGVSAGTVSRALAGSPLVKAKTREQIQALAREHDFRPNQMASKLRTRRTGVIGVVIPLGHERRQHISDPFFMTLLGYLADELTERGYDLMLSRAIPDDTPDWLERITSSGMVDGVIVIGQSDQYDKIERVAANYPNLVAWGTYRPGQIHCVVGTDNRAGGRMAAERLIAGGARKLVFLGDTTGIEIAERLDGARDAIAGRDATLVHLPCHLSNETMEGELREQLRANAGSFDAIVAASDLIAMSAMKVLHEQGMTIPDDVQIIGFDDLPLAAQTMPPLTTIRQDIARGAHEIVADLEASIAGRSKQHVVMEPILMERQTTL
ncbi:LacI family transcriptional regulator [Croceicoccus ponticola]|uniref:LacI family transcriptional regulator n=1 Tax=Croceicoccus ponticola TaxID=2217664 RepID=A0A437GZL5_9SPHN|nr:LacI family DNA-binding transcriptional regulator [Croceicoccus ponticola]RVQ68808.1 LacI family transcriptional regulator [Croceicoccus ponticola]